ncbi:folate transporter 1 [Plasmodium brasilianum]|uniref:Folate transporter 1, putative n=2 Tax=Plasmodium (Plasmodium) TaxID=418103 RepID=A0A1A8X3K5_PLAMA|nr:folate transporter 1, putative [Plasmodium malariae]KAI4839944.1 folate transporter 1 [Plasmodium brasilianum]SBS98337.1 folate transporter 1, putative (FT1) [Plasmodium malariae]SBT87312.1 folate transporter 1, putative [Plasmodium malariae]
MDKDDFDATEKKDSLETCSTLTITSCNSFNESSYLIEKVAHDETDFDADSIFNKISSSLIAMLQGVEVLCNFSILYLFKDNYELHPASLNVILSLIKVPWSIKLLWAVLSDSCPIFGHRRKYYLLFGSFLCVLSLITLGLINHTNITLTVILLTTYFFGSSVCNVIGEAQVVESSRKSSINCSTKNVSIFFAFRKLSFAIMSYLSGYLLSIMTKQHIFLIGSFLPLCVFVSAFFIIEKKNYKKSSIKAQVKCIYDIIKISYIKNFILFIFIMMSMPSCGNTLFFYMTNELKFSPNLLGKMSMFQSLASLIAILSYMFFFNKIDMAKLLLYSTIIITPFCLLPLIVVKKLNAFLYIPNSLFIITDTVLIEFIGEFQTMPILVQCSRIIPEGFESTIYSLLLSSNNLAIVISSFFSSTLTYVLGITSTNFKNLPILITVCCLTNIIPIFFLYSLLGFNNEKKMKKERKKNREKKDKNGSLPKCGLTSEYYHYQTTHYFSPENSDIDEITHLSGKLEINDLNDE